MCSREGRSIRTCFSVRGSPLPVRLPPLAMLLLFTTWAREDTGIGRGRAIQMSHLPYLEVAFILKTFRKEGWNTAKVHREAIRAFRVSKECGELRAQREHLPPSDAPVPSPRVPAALVPGTLPHRAQRLVYHWLLGLWFLAKVCTAFLGVKWTLCF